MSTVKSILVTSELCFNFPFDIASLTTSYLDFEETRLVKCTQEMEKLMNEKFMNYTFNDHWNRIETCQDQRIPHICSDWHFHCAIFVNSCNYTSDDKHNGASDNKHNVASDNKYNVVSDNKDDKNNMAAFRICMPRHKIYNQLAKNYAQPLVKNTLGKTTQTKYKDVIQTVNEIINKNKSMNSITFITNYYDYQLFCTLAREECGYCGGRKQIKCACLESKCRVCSGTGILHTWGGKYLGYVKGEGECKQCKGSGKNHCYQCNNGFLECKKCVNKIVLIKQVYSRPNEGNDIWSSYTCMACCYNSCCYNFCWLKFN